MPATHQSKARIFTGQFFLLCLSSFLFFSSFNMIIPELPAYLRSLGGEDYIGLIIALFTVSAGGSRPFSGKLADTVGRLPVMIIGASVCLICSLIYPFVSTVFAFLLLRVLHGFSTGFQPTGTSAYVADVIPTQRRGEAMGILGVASSLGMASGPVFGSSITLMFSIEVMFYCSSLAALISILIVLGMKETLASPEKIKFSHLKIKRKEILEPRVYAPSIVMVLTTFSFGTILTVIPDLSVSLNLENKGIFFTYFTLVSLGVRLLAGKASDAYGRIPVLKIATVVLTASLLVIGFSTSPAWLLAGAVLYGFGYGMSSPSIFAWTVDLSDDKFRAKALSTMYIALELGIGSGALMSGWLYGNHVERLPYVFGLTAMLTVLSLLFLISPLHKKLTPSVA